MSKKSKQFHIPGLHFWFVSCRFNREDVDKILEALQDFITDLRKKL